MDFTKENLNEILKANLSNEEVIDINEILNQYGINDIDDIDNFKFYKSFDSSHIF